MCPVCQETLIPIVYGALDDYHLSLHKEGKIILSGYRERYSDHPKSYCVNCQEPYNVEVLRNPVVG
jgi:hypothetical protein